MEDELAELVKRIDSMVTPPGPMPGAQPGADQSRHDWEQDVDRIRARHDAAALETHFLLRRPEDDAGVSATCYRDVAVGDGAITVKVYQPMGTGPFPAVVLFHGGGWWMGGGAAGFCINDPLCSRICSEVGAVVVNVDYRLGPEYRHPAQLEDGYQTLKWLLDAAAEFGIDEQRIVTLGISSGGHLAAALSLLLRDRGGPRLAGTALLAPALDLKSLAAQNDPVLAELVEQLLGLYFDTKQDLGLPYVSPARADDLSGLPPTVVVTLTYDPLRDGGVRYVKKLQDQGVPARVLEYPGTHTAATPETRERQLADMVDALKGMVQT
jgi:acetyl esterase